ncbi:hypothetical protein [Deinococcus phoenicis]|uniref:hypothetical protein n=1 Tax=Deinococcus phoenicis TaxID=1476583 RepID=UPI0012687C88|nr:hypothetical protein [Deinococcus phoenicis]
MTFPNLPAQLAKSQKEAAEHQAKLLIAYDLALRVEGLHQQPQLTEDQIARVWTRAKALLVRLT